MQSQNKARCLTSDLTSAPLLITAQRPLCPVWAQNSPNKSLFVIWKYLGFLKFVLFLSCCLGSPRDSCMLPSSPAWVTDKADSFHETFKIKRSDLFEIQISWKTTLTIRHSWCMGNGAVSIRLVENNYLTVYGIIIISYNNYSNLKLNKQHSPNSRDCIGMKLWVATPGPTPLLTGDCMQQERAQILWQGIITQPPATTQRLTVSISASAQHMPFFSTRSIPRLSSPHPPPYILGLAWNPPFSPPLNHILSGSLTFEPLGGWGSLVFSPCLKGSFHQPLLMMQSSPLKRG